MLGRCRSALAVCLVLSCVFSVLGVFGGTAAVSAQATPDVADPVPVVIDSDMISDDWMATLFVLNNPAFSVEAITVTGTGFGYCDAGVASALGLLALTDYGETWRELTGSVASSGGGTRTPDTRIMIPLL